ncbi:MAG TPA: hypothetical protein VFO26_04750 [Gaiella sp.]|uniref:hypothetical protein n=1 Tax=Gaiella sp. TaxID=2663207 RepID=UPI002D7F879B|nr:hypothetical protein [Gaiella sp.]HET9286846.1 hypothetical protein [Gaiella sp.]
MSLERELTSLAASVEWPEAPDVTAAVAGRIAEPAPRPTMHRPRLAVALVVLLAALLAVLAVPPARTAILDWLGIGGARIVRVDQLPAIEPSPGLEILGDEMPLETARSRAGFPFADPPRDEPAPDVIRVAPGIRVSYIWREGERVRLLLTQFPGSVDDPALLKKLVGSSTSVEELAVDGDRGIWLEGGPHVVYFVAPDGDVQYDQGWLAGNTLLVDRDGVTLRIEGALERDEAVQLASAVR